MAAMVKDRSLDFAQVMHRVREVNRPGPPQNPGRFRSRTSPPDSHQPASMIPGAVHSARDSLSRGKVNQPISDPGFSQQMLRLTRIGFELLA